MAKRPSGPRISCIWAGILLISFLILPDVGAAPARYCFGQQATIVGTDTTDRIQGTEGRDVIVSLGGTDYVDAKGGDDLICLGKGGTLRSDRETASGGDGDDLISGGPGADTIDGGPGRDRLSGGPGQDVVYGGLGLDLIRGGADEDQLDGGNDEDVLKGGSSDDYLSGDQGDDLLLGGPHAEAGDTVIYAIKYKDHNGGATSFKGTVHVDLSEGEATGAGRDRLRGTENIFGTGQDDVLIGDDASNFILGSSGDDQIDGRGGSDCLEPSLGNDFVDGGPGFDYFSSFVLACVDDPFNAGITPFGGGITVNLRDGTATLSGDEDGDQKHLVNIEGIYGTSFEDTLIGDDTDNEIFGLGGPDDIQGLAGDDYLDGGSGGGDRVDGGDDFDTCFGELIFSCEDGALLLKD